MMTIKNANNSAMLNDSDYLRPIKIDSFWDRYTRQWIIFAKDKFGNQVGNARFAPNKKIRDREIEMFSKEIENYNVKNQYRKNNSKEL